jgi:hypothetical protein
MSPLPVVIAGCVLIGAVLFAFVLDVVKKAVFVRLKIA